MRYTQPTISKYQSHMLSAAKITTRHYGGVHVWTKHVKKRSIWRLFECFKLSKRLTRGHSHFLRQLTPIHRTKHLVHACSTDLTLACGNVYVDKIGSRHCQGASQVFQKRFGAVFFLIFVWLLQGQIRSNHSEFPISVEYSESRQGQKSEARPAGQVRSNHASWRPTQLGRGPVACCCPMAFCIGCTIQKTCSCFTSSPRTSTWK